MGAQPLAAGRRLRHHLHGLRLALGFRDGDLGGQHPAAAAPGVLLPARLGQAGRTGGVGDPAQPHRQHQRAGA
ncbi:hypothetical protein G6F50_017624 [Rhizopus delemar]|uniref:Uncharacterized protein n=1 Tax=Rhizopus delemar TaxID=936053 RepID=A0A9P7C014_9FUNG|nr:hypothetical protein G6F50_017624 [Rhizopus delemar]